MISFVEKSITRVSYLSFSGQYGPALCLVAVSYTGCATAWSVAMLTLALGLNGTIYSGFNSSHLDIAPNYAGTLMGITNTIANVPAFVAPIVVGHLVNGDVSSF